jgi:hypothetical protein
MEVVNDDREFDLAHIFFFMYCLPEKRKENILL